MPIDFANVVEEVKQMSFENKEELKFLLDKYLIEEKRNEIEKKYLNALDEVKEGTISYSKDINTLKHILEK